MTYACTGAHKHTQAHTLAEVGKGYWTSRTGVAGACEPSDVGAENRTRVLRKSGECSIALSHLPSPDSYLLPDVKANPLPPFSSRVFSAGRSQGALAGLDVGTALTVVKIIIIIF